MKAKHTFARLVLAAAFVMLSTSGRAGAENLLDLSLEDLVRLDIFAPAVLSSHIHRKGEWMVGYRFMRMDMEGSRDGTGRLSDASVLQDFMITPTSMSMGMHMVHLMYAPTNKVTLIAMLEGHDKSMSHLTRTGMRFDTASSGLGDLGLMVNQVVGEWEGDETVHKFNINYGVSIPTGSIDETDFVMPMMAVVRLPYPMQLGSGTYDLLPGVGYMGYGANYYWGTQLEAVIRTGRNSQGYRVGNQYSLNTWGSKVWTDAVATSIHLDVTRTGNIDGTDPMLNPMMVPTADPNRRGGTAASIRFAVDLHASKGMFDNQTLSLAIEQPVYQKLDGPQLEVDTILRAGWQIIF